MSYLLNLPLQLILGLLFLVDSFTENKLCGSALDIQLVTDLQENTKLF